MQILSAGMGYICGKTGLANLAQLLPTIQALCPFPFLPIFGGVLISNSILTLPAFQKYRDGRRFEGQVAICCHMFGRFSFYLLANFT